jgi:translation initiation factor IF-3
VADLGFIETSAKQDGRNMTMVLAPHKGAKTRVKAQEAAQAPQAKAAPRPAPASAAEPTAPAPAAPGEQPATEQSDAQTS